MRHALYVSFVYVLAVIGCGGQRTTDPQQPGTIANVGLIVGVATDTHTKLPISFVTVEATGTGGSAEATTGAHGKFELEGLAPGSYKVVARFRDHKLVFTNVPVKKGERTIVDVSIASMDVPEFRVSSWDPNVRNDHGHSHNHPSPVVDKRPPEVPKPGPQTKHAVAGHIRGIVRDQASKESLAGAVVSATAPHLRDALMALSDDDGNYRLFGLRPGTYTLSVYYHLIDRGNMETRRTNVAVSAGKVTTIDLELDAITDQ